jgi:hypothetical protein
MNIEDKANQIMISLNQMGFGEDVDVPLLATSKQNWNKDFAVMDGMYFDRITHKGKAQLDDNELLQEFGAFIKPIMVDHFVLTTSDSKYKKGTIVVYADIVLEQLTIFRVLD